MILCLIQSEGDLGQINMSVITEVLLLVHGNSMQHLTFSNRLCASSDFDLKAQVYLIFHVLLHLTNC